VLGPSYLFHNVQLSDETKHERLAADFQARMTDMAQRTGLASYLKSWQGEPPEAVAAFVDEGGGDPVADASGPSLEGQREGRALEPDSSLVDALPELVYDPRGKTLLDELVRRYMLEIGDRGVALDRDDSGVQPRGALSAFFSMCGNAACSLIS
jgi:hypothetical protein